MHFQDFPPPLTPAPSLDIVSYGIATAGAPILHTVLMIHLSSVCGSHVALEPEHATGDLN